MDDGQPASPARAAFFYSVLLFLLVQIGGQLQGQFRLAGGMLTQLLILLGVPLFFAWYFDRRRLADLFRLRALTFVGVVKSVLLGLIGWALAYLVGAVVFALVIRAGGSLPQVYEQLTSAPFSLALLAGAIIPAVCEEMAFRGYLLFNLAPLGRTASVVLTAILFGAMHMSLVRVLPLVLLGFLFASAVQRSGSILPGMIMHLVNNGVALVLTFFYQPSPAKTPDGSALTAGSILTALVMALGLSVVAAGLVRTFSPGDLVRPSGHTEPEGEPGEGLGRMLVPLIPAALLYAWAAGSEVVRVFARR